MPVLFPPVQVALPGSHRTFMGVSLTLILVLTFCLVIGWRWHFKVTGERRTYLAALAKAEALRKQQTMPDNAAIVTAPGTQQPENPSMLVSDARPLRFDANASVVPEPSVVEVLPTVNASSVLAEAMQVIEKYTGTPRWQDRLMYVHDQGRVRKLMEDFYEVQHGVDPIMGALMSQTRYRINSTEIVLLAYRSARMEGKLEVALRKNDAGRLVMDWESFVGYSEKSFAELMKNRSTKPTLLRALVKIDDYYNFEFDNSNEYLSLKLNAPDGEESLHAFCKRDGVLGRWIADDLGDNPAKSLVKGYTLWVSYPPEAKSNSCLNLDQVAAGRWLIVPPK